jgi:hypothetical protein
MTAKQILKSVELDPDKSILSITKKEAVEKLLAFFKNWELSIRITDINKEDWEILFDSYSDAIITYHIENDHQERGTVLRNQKMLMKYGLTNNDIARLDFC